MQSAMNEMKRVLRMNEWSDRFSLVFRNSLRKNCYYWFNFILILFSLTVIKFKGNRGVYENPRKKTNFKDFNHQT